MGVITLHPVAGLRPNLLPQGERRPAKEVAVPREVFQGVLARISWLDPAPGQRVFPVPIGEREGGPGGGVRLGAFEGSKNAVAVVLLSMNSSYATLSMVFRAEQDG